MVDATHTEVSAQRAMVSLRRAAELLGISTATVRNWTRSGLLEAADVRRPMKVWRDEVLRLQLEFVDSSTGRLQSRANKTQSGAPIEYPRACSDQTTYANRASRTQAKASGYCTRDSVGCFGSASSDGFWQFGARQLSLLEFRRPPQAVAIRELQGSVGLETTEDLVGLMLSGTFQ